MMCINTEVALSYCAAVVVLSVWSGGNVSWPLFFLHGSADGVCKSGRPLFLQMEWNGRGMVKAMVMSYFPVRFWSIPRYI